jgi:hypothetical protein
MGWRWAVAGGAVLLVAVAGIYAASRAPSPVAAHLARPARTPALEIERVPDVAVVPTALNVAAAGSETSGPVIKQMPSEVAPDPQPTIEPGSGDPDQGIAFTRDGDGSSMTIALVGSARGMVYYRLADPPGVVVNLPRSYPRSSTGVHGNLPGAFKKVIIQRKGTGSVLRVYHRDADLIPQVLSDKVGLRVTLKTKRRS